MRKKILMVLIGLLAIGILAVVGNKLYWNYRVAHATIIVELATNKVFVYQSDVTIQKLLKKLNGTLITNPKVPTDVVGKQEITFRYKNDENIPIDYTVEIEVIDVTPPMIFQGRSKSITEGYEDDIATELFCGDNYDPNPKCYIEGDYDQNTPGSYDVVFVGEDSSGNKTTHAFTLNVRRKTNGSSGGGGVVEYTDFQEMKEKYQGENVFFGIDISHHQGDIDFQKVKDAGVDFVYIRIGRGNGVGKEYVEDTKFEQNLKGFNEVGIPVGVYFYSNANGSKDAIEEAKWLIKKTKNYQVDLEYVFDWENWQFFQEYDLSFYGLKKMYQSFEKTIKKAGKTSMLYSSKSYLESVWGDMKTPIWLAHYTSQTDYQGDYLVWQICDDGKVAGIRGAVDLNIRYHKKSV